MTGATADEEQQLHACTWPGCTKSYKRLDHLERHQKTHSGDLNYRCHICNKQYSRSDVLNRHLVQTHGEKGAPAGRPRRAACMGCVDDRVACDGVPPRVCSRCKDMARPCRYRHLEMEAKRGGGAAAANTTAAAAPTTTTTPTTKPQPIPASSPTNLPSVSSHSMDQAHETPSEPSVSTSTPSTSLFSMLGPDSSLLTGTEPLSMPTNPLDTLVAALPLPSQQPPYPVSLPGLLPTTNPWADPGPPALPIGEQWLTEFLLSATIQDMQDSPSNLISSLVPATNVGWGFSESPDMFDPLNGPVSPEQREQRERDKKKNLIDAVYAEELDGINRPDEELPAGRKPSDSVWPSVYRPNTPERVLDLPETQPRGELPADGKGIPNTTRSMMESLARQAHSACWPMPNLGNFPSASALTACVNLYLNRFAEWCPIIDSPRGTFVMAKAAPLLLKAMAAVGSVYARDGLERLGTPLAELVRREITYICEHDPRFMYEIAVVQASLLQAYFGMFGGSPRLFQQAEVTRAGLVTSCRRMRLLDRHMSAVAHVQRQGGSKEELDRAVTMDHRRNRLGWAIFLYDSQVEAYCGLSAQMRQTEIDCALPTVMPDTSGNSPTFRQTMTNLLEKGTFLPQQLDDIALCCIAHALYRICLSSALAQSFQPKRHGTNPAQTLPSMYEIHPQILLDQLGRHTLRVAVPTHLTVSCAALAYHSQMVFTEVGLLDRIKVAAGRLVVNTAEAQQVVTEWMKKNPVATRNVVAHAALLFALMGRFPFDTPLEVPWNFDAAWILWAYLRFGNSKPPSGSASIRTVKIGWSWTPELGTWIETGKGTVSIDGLGRIPGLTPRAVLLAGADRLEASSWGLAGRYRKVLLGVVMKEK